MSTTPTPVDETTEQYIHLQALSLVLGGLGPAFQAALGDADRNPHDEAYDIGFGGEHPSLFQLDGQLRERDEPLERLLTEARADLLAARLLRSITPAALEQAARNFEAVGHRELAAFAAERRRRVDAQRDQGDEPPRQGLVGKLTIS